MGTQYNKSGYNPPFLPLVSLISIVYFLYYLWWRATATLNPEAPLFSWVLVLAEAFGVLCYVLFSWITHDILPTREYKTPRPGLKVDVLIPTYNEDLEILEATLVGCRGIRYPHTTYILDDGNRLDVRELALGLGAKYMARPTHEHAKAGNINHALLHTDGEFAAILDADMVPQPDYLDRTLGYFEDEKLALIQLPQEFYNQDSVQHAPATPSWHEQALFFRVIQPGKNHTNSAFWCGSPSVVRRKALMDVGGVATETITEDIHTTVRLHSRGWQTLFLNEDLAYGIAPQTMEAFLLQRLRWAQGTMQLYRSKESPLWIPGLTIQQRLSYLSSFLAYFESFQKLVLILTPILILTLGLFPMRVEMGEFLLVWLPYFGLNILANQVGGRGIFQYFKTEKFNILKAIVFLQSMFTLVYRKPLKFKVTPKSVDASVYAKETRALRSYMGIAGVLAGAMIYGMMKIFTLQAWHLSMDVFIIAFFWAAYNQLVILSALSEVFQKRHERKHYRFPLEINGKLIGRDATHAATKVHVLDLSISGARVTMEDNFPIGSGGLLLFLEAPDGAMLLPVKKLHHRRLDDSGKLTAGISFAMETGVQRERLFEYLFVYLPTVDTSYDDRLAQLNKRSQVRSMFVAMLSRFRPARL